jgi:tetratricopeptide (TPR) repeat protein
MAIHGRVWPLLLALGALYAAPAAAFNFTPTEAQWLMWPDYCKARYVTTGAGGRSPFANAFPRSSVETWRSALGEDTFTDIHHYCAAIATTNTALSEPDPKHKKALLGYALDNASYAIARTPKTSFIYLKAAVNLATIESALGHPDRAVAYAQQGIDAQPKLSEGYCVMAQILFKQKKTQEARDILIRGNEVLEGKSPEIHYNLGLMELELGNKQAAVEHAKQAYALGHPLPGLQRKLERAGLWTDEAAEAAGAQTRTE